MKLDQFSEKCDLVNKTEIEKVALLAFYYYKKENKKDINFIEIKGWFESLNFTIPNMSRLAKRLSKSPVFTRGKEKETIKLHPKQIAKFENEDFKWVNDESEEVVFSGEILPESVFAHTRGYIEILAKQINSSYEHNLFDGCAVLMRRLIEILLIHTYQFIGQEEKIMNSQGQHIDLSAIIKHAINNSLINLTKDSKGCLDTFRVLGNFSAHKIEYNCRRGDIKKVSLDYRATIEELLYKSGILI